MIDGERPNPADAPADRRQPAYDAVYDFINGLGAAMPADPVRRNGMIWSAVRLSLDAMDHSGVAGEPEATTRGSCCPEFARSGYAHTEVCPTFDSPTADPAVRVAASSPTPVPAPDPVGPAATGRAGAAGITDEMVEAYLNAGLTDVGLRAMARQVFIADPHAGGADTIRTALGAVAPLIAAQTLREAAEEFVRPGEVFDSLALGWAERKLRRRADELEQGADR